MNRNNWGGSHIFFLSLFIPAGTVDRMTAERMRKIIELAILLKKEKSLCGLCDDDEHV